jgi:hypothetical protein
MSIRIPLLAGLVLASVALAQDELASKMINSATNGSWYFQPDKPKAKYLKADVPGGMAFRVKATKSANPWDVQASSPIAGAINEGDVVMINFYARAEEPAEGGSKLAVRIQMNAAPWTSVLETTAPITSEWKAYCAHRISPATLGEKKSTVSIHLATAKQVIDLGPVFVFNFGKGFDEKSLKGCDG